MTSTFHKDIPNLSTRDYKDKIWLHRKVHHSWFAYSSYRFIRLVISFPFCIYSHKTPFSGVLWQFSGLKILVFWNRNLLGPTYRLWKNTYSYLSNSQGGWNKRGRGAKIPKLINKEVGINVEGGIFWKKNLFST